MHELLALDPEDICDLDSCLFWAEPCGEKLFDSLRLWGQMEPVLVEKKSNRFSLIAGYKRYLAARNLSRTLYAWQQDSPGAWEKGVFYILSNWGQQLTPGRIISALRYFQPLTGDHEHIYSLLGISEPFGTKNMYTAWLSLPQSLDPLLENNPHLLACARQLGTWSHQDLQALSPFLERLHWSRNKAVKFVDLLSRNAARNNATIQDIADQLGLADILDKDLSPKDKMQNLLEVLYRSGYPEYFRLMDETQKRLKQWTKDTGWRCNHPNRFESPDLEFSIRVQNFEHLRHAAQQLQEISESRLLDTWPVYPYDR